MSQLITDVELLSGLENADVIEGVNKLFQVCLTPAAAAATATLTWTDKVSGGSKAIKLAAAANGASVTWPDNNYPTIVRRQDVTVTLTGAGAQLAASVVGYQKVIGGAPLPIYVNGLENLISRTTVLREDDAELVSRLISRVVTSANLVSQITAGFFGIEKNLVSQITCLQPASHNLPARITPICIPQTANLVCRVTPTEVNDAKDIPAQVTVYKTSSVNLVCRITELTP